MVLEHVDVVEMLLVVGAAEEQRHPRRDRRERRALPRLRRVARRVEAVPAQAVGVEDRRRRRARVAPGVPADDGEVRPTCRARDARRRVRRQILDGDALPAHRRRRERVHVVVAVRPRQRAAAVHVQLLLHEERAVAAARRELHARRAVDGEVALLLLELEGGRERE